MPVDDNSRIGPNQDINDPSLLIEVGYEFNKTSQAIGDIIARIASDDVNQSGSKITDIIIPLKISDGTTVDFDCETITKDEELNIFDYDKILWGGGLINTYVDLAEKFRNYWNIMNSGLNFPTPYISGIASSGSGVSPSIILETGTSSPDYSLSLITLFNDTTNWYTSNIFLVQPSTPREEPVWSGSGPTNYNSGTYPQLLQAGGGTHFFEEDSNIRPFVFPLSSQSLGHDNFVRQKYEKYGQGKVFTSNPYIGTRRDDSPELVLKTTIGQSNINLFSSAPFPSLDNFIIFNTSNEPLNIIYGLLSRGNISAQRIDSEGSQASTTFVGGTAFLVQTSININGTGILSTADITTWPPIHSNFDQESSVINNNPLNLILNASISNTFVLPAKTKCVLRAFSFCSLVGVSIPIIGAASFTHLINSTYSFRGIVNTTINFGTNSFSLPLNRVITN